MSSTDNGGTCTTSKRDAPSRNRPQRARGVAAGQDDAIAAGGDRVDEIVEHPPQAREALEGAQFEKLIEQERRRLSAAGAGAG